MYKRYKDVSLILKIVIGIVVGAVLGVLVPSWSFIDILGKLFVGALKAIAPLLVFLLIMSAISKYRSSSKNHFGTVIVLYLSATLLLSSIAAVAVPYYQKGPSTFGMEILSNTKNSRPKKRRSNRYVLRPSFLE
ncbi:Serine/threonine transporter SstT [Lactobacillus helveticus]|nr:Serine/threonine transporter SstT [Lactobacillus helveticus]